MAGAWENRAAGTAGGDSRVMGRVCQESTNRRVRTALSPDRPDSPLPGPPLTAQPQAEAALLRHLTFVLHGRIIRTLFGQAVNPAPA